jgi:hypothetical protein
MLAIAPSVEAGSLTHDGLFAIIGGVAATVTLGAYPFIEVIKPARRRRQSRHPCNVYFSIMPATEGKIDYAIQDERGHHVKELVLSENSETDIELVYIPKLPFYESKIAFGCESGIEGKPYAFECFDRFTIKGETHWIPGRDHGHSLNRQKFYQIVRHEHRNVGTDFVVGFRLKTEKPGLFPMKIFFFTDEVEGSGDLTIRVEEKPRTPMQCARKEHWDCYVYPNTPR